MLLGERTELLAGPKVGRYMAHGTHGGASKVGKLLVIAPLRIPPSRRGQCILTRKFVDGMEAYASRWPGGVGVLAQPGDAMDDNLDHVEVDPRELPFAVDTCDFLDHRAVTTQLRKVGLVLAGLDTRLEHVYRLCQTAGVPIVHVAETSLRTRRQIVRAEVSNPLRRAVRWWREARRETFFQEVVKHSAGVQCNGTPTYKAYRSLSRSPLLFFDTRVSAVMVASSAALSSRLAELRSGGPLRLGFSGRLVAIKGVDHLPKVAAELRQLGVKFTLDIFGGGDLAGQVDSEAKRLAVADSVRVRGVVDFNRELVPFMTRHIDLFVCCHRQGDPSCTYLETLACGVPVAGYDNEALSGLVRHSGVGWITPMDRPLLLAEQIAALDRSRSLLVDAARQSREFALGNTFEQTMDRRIEHMLSCAQAPRATVSR